MRCLFVCTGNYYRSRFAELLVNHLSKEKGIKVIAVSRGLAPGHADNIGLVSPHVISYLEYLNIHDCIFGPPQKLSEDDFKNADKIIALDENEHRPLIEKLFPAWEQKVEYWKFEDDYIVKPNELLPRLERRIVAFLSGIEHDS